MKKSTMWGIFAMILEVVALLLSFSIGGWKLFIIMSLVFSSLICFIIASKEEHLEKSQKVKSHLLW